MSTTAAISIHAPKPIFHGLPSCLIDDLNHLPESSRPNWLSSHVPFLPSTIYRQTNGLKTRLKNQTGHQGDLSSAVSTAKYLRKQAPRIESYKILHENSSSQAIDFSQISKWGIESQFLSISNLKLIQLIALYRLKRLTKLDIRVFLAALEMRERRLFRNPNCNAPRYSVEEIKSLVKVSLRNKLTLKHSLDRLEKNGVLRFTDSEIKPLDHIKLTDKWFEVVGDEEFKAEHKLVRKLIGHDALIEKTVKLPRRVLRHIACSRSFALVATTLTLYARKCDARFSRAVLGAGMVSRVFKQSLKTSYRKLAELQALAIIRKHPFLNNRMRVRNAHGTTYEFNANCLPPQGLAAKRSKRSHVDLHEMSTLFKEYLNKLKILPILNIFSRQRAELKRKEAQERISREGMAGPEGARLSQVTDLGAKAKQGLGGQGELMTREESFAVRKMLAEGGENCPRRALERVRAAAVMQKEKGARGGFSGVLGVVFREALKGKELAKGVNTEQAIRERKALLQRQVEMLKRNEYP